MIGKAATSEDFTFPTITDSNSLQRLRFSGPASSLWYISSPQSHPNSSNDSNFPFDHDTHQQRRSFSFVEGGSVPIPLPKELDFLRRGHFNSDGATSNAGFDSEEEKMDVLWEDFNDCEEFDRVPLGRKEAESSKGAILDPTICSESGADRIDMAEVRRAHGLKVSRTTAALSPHKKPIFFMVLKVLKKVFLLHNNHAPERRRHFHSR